MSRKLEGDPPRYVSTRVGAIFENEKGNLSVKIDAGFSIHNAIGVTINGFVPRPKQAIFGGYNNGTRPATPPRPAAPSPASGTAEEEWEL